MIRNTADLHANGWVMQHDGSWTRGAKRLPPEKVETVAAAEKRLRQSSKPDLNKLESAFLLHLREQLGQSATILAHDLTFRLGNGVRYTPDFVVFYGGLACCYEVKGPRAWDDAIVKLKVAPGKYPMFKWVLAWRDGGKWKLQTMLP